MRIFLTGGTGFIGGHVLKLAMASGHDLVALRRPGASPRIPLVQQPHWVEGTLYDDWSEILGSCEAFIHLAAFGVVGSDAHDWEACFQINVMDSLRLWRQAAVAGIRRFLVVGSCLEYGRSGERYEAIPVSAPLEPTTAYGASKAAASVAALGLAVDQQLCMVVARPFHVYGPGQAGSFWPSLVSAAINGQDLPMTTGSQVRDYQPVEQAAAQLFAWLQHPHLQPGIPKVVNLGTGSPRSLLEFAQAEWSFLKTTATLQPGALPYRPNEVFRYVPEVTVLPGG